MAEPNRQFQVRIAFVVAGEVAAMNESAARSAVRSAVIRGVNGAHLYVADSVTEVHEMLPATAPQEMPRE